MQLKSAALLSFPDAAAPQIEHDRLVLKAIRSLLTNICTMLSEHGTTIQLCATLVTISGGRGCDTNVKRSQHHH